MTKTFTVALQYSCKTLSSDDYAILQNYWRINCLRFWIWVIGIYLKFVFWCLEFY